MKLPVRVLGGAVLSTLIVLSSGAITVAQCSSRVTLVEFDRAPAAVHAASHRRLAGLARRS